MRFHDLRLEGDLAGAGIGQGLNDPAVVKAAGGLIK